MKYKKWSLEQKLEILTCCEEIGVVETCHKYGVGTGIFIVGRKSMRFKVKRA
jgi:putative transposase